MSKVGSSSSSSISDTSGQVPSLSRYGTSTRWKARLHVWDAEKQGGPGWKWVNRSTGTDDRGAAVSIAVEMQAIASAVGRQAEVAFLKGDAIAGSTGSDRGRGDGVVLDESRALEAVQAIVRLAGGGLRAESGEVLPIGDDGAVDRGALWSVFSEKWLKEKTLGRKAQTRSTYGCVLNRFEEWACSVRGMDGERLVLSLVSPLWIEEFRDWLGSLGLGAKRVNFHLKVLSMVFKKAVMFEVVNRNPVAAVSLVTEVKGVDGVPGRPFSDAEFAQLLLAPVELAADLVDAGDAEARFWGEEIVADWRLAILLAGRMGLRVGDTMALRWEQVLLAEGAVNFVPAKTRDSSEVEVWFPVREYAPDLWAALVERAADPGASVVDGKAAAGVALSGRVLPVLSMVGNTGFRGLSWRFRTLMERAGIVVETVVEREGLGRNRSSHHFHSLRHTAITNARLRGVPKELRMALFGHTTEEVHDQYGHWDAPGLRAAVVRAIGGT